MTTLLARMVTLYLGFHASKMDPRPEDRKDAEIADGAGELGFFPPYSWWPLWCGADAGGDRLRRRDRRLVAGHHRRRPGRRSRCAAGSSSTTAASTPTERALVRAARPRTSRPVVTAARIVLRGASRLRWASADTVVTVAGHAGLSVSRADVLAPICQSRPLAAARARLDRGRCRARRAARLASWPAATATPPTAPGTAPSAPAATPSPTPRPPRRRLTTNVERGAHRRRRSTRRSRVDADDGTVRRRSTRDARRRGTGRRQARRATRPTWTADGPPRARHDVHRDAPWPPTHDGEQVTKRSHVPHRRPRPSTSRPTLASRRCTARPSASACR